MFAKFKIKSFLYDLFFPVLSSLISTCDLAGQFLIQNVVPQESGECAKVKVKVRVNVHGVFSVSNASSVETIKTPEGEEPMETEQAVKEEEVCVYVCNGWRGRMMCVRRGEQKKEQCTLDCISVLALLLAFTAMSQTTP